MMSLLLQRIICLALKSTEEDEEAMQDPFKENPVDPEHLAKWAKWKEEGEKRRERAKWKRAAKEGLGSDMPPKQKENPTVQEMRHECMREFQERSDMADYTRNVVKQKLEKRKADQEPVVHGKGKRIKLGHPEEPITEEGTDIPIPPMRPLEEEEDLPEPPLPIPPAASHIIPMPYLLTAETT